MGSKQAWGGGGGGPKTFGRQAHSKRGRRIILVCILQFCDQPVTRAKLTARQSCDVTIVLQGFSLC